MAAISMRFMYVSESHHVQHCDVHAVMFCIVEWLKHTDPGLLWKSP